MIVYISNVRATRKKLYDRSHQGYFNGYAATTGDILYWKPDQPFVIHRAHHFWFDEYKSRLSIIDNHILGSLLLRQYYEGLINNSELLNLISCELDLTPTQFSDIQSITYETELPPSEKKTGFNLLLDISMIQS